MSDKQSVLIVDDEAPFRLNLAILLEDLGFRVAEAANGHEALAAVERERPALVLTDLRMPEMDGLTLIRQLSCRHPEVPLVAISGVGTIRDALEAVRNGAWDYLVKPIDDEETFGLIVGRALERARLQAENRRYREDLEQLVRRRTAELERANRELAAEVAEHRRVERERRMLDQALDGSRDSVYLIDERFRFAYANDTACRTLGYSREEFLALSQVDIDPDLDPELVSKSWHELQADGRPVSRERRHRTRDGRIFPVEIGFSPCEFDGERFNLAVVRDVTERKLVEDTLRFIAQRDWMASAESFLFALARHLGESFGVDYVLVDRLPADDPGYAETVALYAKGELLPPMRYHLEGTPCENVAGKRLCCYPSQVQALFPADTLLAEMGAESYLGIPLWDAEGRPLGLLAVLDGKPLAEAELVARILQLVAMSAAAALERERSEALLTRREREFRTLAENSPDQIIRFDRELRMRYLNPQAAKTLGLRAEELVGRVLTGANLDCPQYLTTVASVIQSGKQAELEMLFPLDGEPRFHQVRVVAERDPEGKILGALAIGRDITSRREYEVLLLEQAEQQARLSSFVNNVPGFFYTLVRHRDGRFTMPFASSGLRDFFGVDPELVKEGVGPFVARIAPEDREMVFQKIRESERSLAHFHAEYRIVHPEKGVRWIECHSIPQAEHGGARWHGFMHDVTERKRAEAQLQEQREHLNAMTLELSLAEERERCTIATELHDHLGQDLTLAKIKLGMLAKDLAAGSEHAAPLVAETRKILDRVIHAVRALTHRINPPILESGSLEAALKWLTRQVGLDYGLTVRFRDDPQEKTLEQELRPVVYHAVRELLINAAKHARAKKVWVELTRADCSLMVEVGDDGIGFDPTGIDEHGSVGEGFGLFNVRRRVRHLGGSFAVASSPGSGTRVTIGMPLAKGPGRAGKDQQGETT